MKLPCKNVPEEFCLNNICVECHKPLKTIEERISYSVSINKATA